jgi:tetratricopeptide (TPR) repeat protein
MAQAVMDLTGAIDREAKTEFMSNRAQCFFEQGLYDRAIMDLSHALELDTQDPQLYYKRGLTRYSQKMYRLALKDLKAAIQYDPYPANLADIYYHLAVSYANLGRHIEAVPALDQAVLRCPHFPHYVHERAKSLQVCGEHDKALQDFTRVLEMQPTNARALFRRAFSFKALKCYEEAAEDFEAAREFEPEDPRLVRNYRKIYSIACISLGPAGHEDTTTYKAE